MRDCVIKVCVNHRDSGSCLKAMVTASRDRTGYDGITQGTAKSHENHFEKEESILIIPNSFI